MFIIRILLMFMNNFFVLTVFQKMFHFPTSIIMSFLFQLKRGSLTPMIVIWILLHLIFNNTFLMNLILQLITTLLTLILMRVKMAILSPLLIVNIIV